MPNVYKRKVTALSKTEKNDKGEFVTKHYTNFFIEENGIYIPIQPVNFGKEQNRKNYNYLSLIAIEKNDMPF